MIELEAEGNNISYVAFQKSLETIQNEFEMESILNSEF